MTNLLMLVLAAGAALETATTESDRTDLFCGPRCAWFVLDLYGKRTELVDTIRQTQWPEVERGASLASLKELLERHGIYTLGIEMRSPSSFSWDFATIMHLRPDAGSRGHFVVLQPADGSGDVTIWNGVAGFQRVAPGWLEDRMSGIVLLTSPNPIDPQMLRNAKPNLLSSNWAWFCGGIVMVAVPALWRGWGSLFFTLRRSQRC